MKLKSLDDFPGLTELREKMGASELGEFELFDPQRHITYSEREALNLGELNLQSQQLRILKDKTLAFKNSRVWLSWSEELNPVYHLAACQSVQKRRHMKQAFSAGIGFSGVDVPVCVECLQLLKYQGLDARRGRRLDNETLQREFSLEEFQGQYPFYPLI